MCDILVYFCGCRLFFIPPVKITLVDIIYVNYATTFMLADIKNNTSENCREVTNNKYFVPSCDYLVSRSTISTKYQQFIQIKGNT